MRRFVARPRGFRSENSKGFTLVELVIALAVLLLLLSVGIPHSMSLLTNNRLTSRANDMVQAFAHARSEAINRTAEVRVVPTNPADWSQGWTLVADINKDGDFSDAEDLVRIGNAMPGAITLTADGANNLSNDYVAFNARGTLDPLGDTFVYNLSVADCTGFQVRRVTVAASGRPSVATLSCP